MRKLLLGLSLTLIFLPQFTLAGFGVSPPSVREDKLVKGVTFERTIYLVQGNPEADVSIAIDVDDSPVKSWLSFDPGTSFTIPKGVQQFPLKIKVSVPQDASLGIYKTFVRARTVPITELGTSTAGVSIALGARIDIDLTVGEGTYYAFKITDLKFLNIKETDDPMANIRIENIGNVPAGPDKATFELFNSFGDLRLAFVQGVSIEQVPAFQTDTVLAKFPIPVRLSPGEYWGTLRLYDDDKLLREYKDAIQVRQATFWDKYKIYFAIGGGAFVLAIIVLIVLRAIFARGKKK